MPEQRIGEGLPDWIKDHLQRYIDSDGEDGYLWDAALAGGEGKVPTLLLTTTGRKSGLTLTLPLIFGKTETGYCIIASKGGAPAHPAWFLNLEANAQVHLQVKAEKFNATARIAEGAEREQLWQQMVEIYPPYTDYQAATERQIPVVVIEP
jgi:deazaflavin-dependent oxidoreductase (nitroreductase family)